MQHDQKTIAQYCLDDDPDCRGSGDPATGYGAQPASAQQPGADALYQQMAHELRLTGYHDWDLHSGLNVSLGASVFTGFGKHAPSGAGFAQNVSGMYAVPFNDKLSLAFGGYFLNANWGGMNLRDAGLSAVLGYRFNERWEGYVYGQKSLIRPKTAWPYCWGMNELGDRIGAAIKYNFSPSFSIQVSVEEHKYSLHEK